MSKRKYSDSTNSNINNEVSSQLGSTPDIISYEEKRLANIRHNLQVCKQFGLLYNPFILQQFDHVDSNNKKVVHKKNKTKLNKLRRSTRIKNQNNDTIKVDSDSNDDSYHNDTMEVDSDSDSDDSNDDDDDVECDVCRTSNEQNQIVTCDTCDLSYHIYCLHNQLSRVPRHKWTCDPCKDNKSTRRTRQKKQSNNIDEDFCNKCHD